MGGSSTASQEFLLIWRGFQIKGQCGQSWEVLEGLTQLFSTVWASRVAIWAGKPPLLRPLQLGGPTRPCFCCQRQSYYLTSILVKVDDSFIFSVFLWSCYLLRNFLTALANTEVKFNNQFQRASLITMKTDEVQQTPEGFHIMRTFRRKTRPDKHLICHIWVSGITSSPFLLGYIVSYMFPYH